MKKWDGKRRFFDFKFIRHERRRSLILACIFFWSIISFQWFHNHLIGSVIVQGDSMWPTLVHGESILMYRWSLWFRDPRPEDIVVLKDPLDRTLSVKRIIAIPKDQIKIYGKQVYVNGKILKEPYLSPDMYTPAYLTL